jgi:hypothetical protein
MESQQIVPVGNPAPVADKQFEQGAAVLPARDHHRHPVPFGQQVELLAGPCDGLGKKAMRSESLIIASFSRSVYRVTAMSLKITAASLKVTAVSLTQGAGHKPNRERGTEARSARVSPANKPGT